MISPRIGRKPPSGTNNSDDESEVSLIGVSLKTPSNLKAAMGWDSRALGKLTKLVLVHTSMTSSSITDEIFTELWALEHLNMSNNSITTIPKEIAKLQRLKWLNLSMNKLEILPPALSQLTDLWHLDLSYNKLTSDSLPASFFTLNSLERLYLSDNQLEVLTPEFGSLNSLKVLALRSNNLTKLSVRAFGGLRMLGELHLQGNQLRFLPPTMSQLPELRGSSSILKLLPNPWIPPIKEQLRPNSYHGSCHEQLFEYLGSHDYRIVYEMNNGRRSFRQRATEKTI